MPGEKQDETMPSYSTDELSFRRDYKGHTIFVVARFLSRPKEWSLEIKVDGEWVAADRAKDPWKAALGHIEAELLALDPFIHGPTLTT